MVKAVVGANWGDEGKGKITDMLAKEADIIIRFQGGANRQWSGIKHSCIIQGNQINHRPQCAAAEYFSIRQSTDCNVLSYFIRPV